MAIIIRMLATKWPLDRKSIADLSSLANFGVAGYMEANCIAGKLIKKAAMGEPLTSASTFISQSVWNAKKKIQETGS